MLCGAVSAGCGSAGGTPPPTAPPTLPEPARHGDGQGATSFASHWLDLVDYAYQTLDAGPLRDLGLPSCQTCAQFVAQLDTDRAAGARYRGGRVHFVSADPSDVQQDRQATVTVTFDQDDMRVIDRAGRQVDAVPAGRTVFVFDLRWTPAGWRAAAVRLGVADSSTPTPTR
ncbi:DUF6318 family protein [Gandjariella thermophila]|uniref:DUF6318 domain-containing protein n=1 Tax=Gandjariella thermophila TaxID=1931992 RepID=A0A4D4J8N2_9PSEU|nr:DUF6318 family protein [Gandjariella thermophila]GDY33175.1 hypothetical protein GTS_48080 [Gandjariella thermophila]